MNLHLPMISLCWWKPSWLKVWITFQSIIENSVCDQCADQHHNETLPFVIRFILGFLMSWLSWHQAAGHNTYYVPFRLSKTAGKIIFLDSHFDLLTPAMKGPCCFLKPFPLASASSFWLLLLDPFLTTDFLLTSRHLLSPPLIPPNKDIFRLLWHNLIFLMPCFD